MILTLFFQFMGFSLISFGGGYTVLPILIDTFVTNERFWTMDQFGSLLSISQITPGPISLNAAAFIGYLKGGIIGTLAAGIGLVLPTLFLSSIALYFLGKAKQNSWIQGCLKGARLAALSMVGYTVFLFLGMSVFKTSVSVRDLFSLWISNHITFTETVTPDLIGVICFVTSLVLTLKYKYALTPVLIFSALTGVFLGWIF